MPVSREKGQLGRRNRQPRAVQSIMTRPLSPMCVGMVIRKSSPLASCRSVSVVGWRGITEIMFAAAAERNLCSICRRIPVPSDLVGLHHSLKSSVCHEHFRLPRRRNQPTPYSLGRPGEFRIQLVPAVWTAVGLSEPLADTLVSEDVFAPGQTQRCLDRALGTRHSKIVVADDASCGVRVSQRYSAPREAGS